MTTAEQAHRRTFHYVMTMQAGDQFRTVEGTLHVPQGEANPATRTGAFAYVRNLLIQELGPGGAVLVWSFEPNEL